MGWLHNWTTRKSDPRVSFQYLAASEGIRPHLSPFERRKDKGNTKGNGGDRNRINGGRRGDNRAEDQGGGKDRENGDSNNNNNNNGDNNDNDNKNNGGKDEGGKKKPTDHSSSQGPPPSVTTTVTSVEPPTTVVIPPPTFTSILTTTEISTVSTITTQTGDGATPTSFTISSTNSVPASSSSVESSSSSSIIPTTVLPTAPSTSSTQGSTPAISSSELSTGAKAGIAIAALSAFALILGGIYLCWRRGASRTRVSAGAQPENPGAHGSLVQGAVGMAQARRDSLSPRDHEGDPAPIHSASWRTTHPWRPPSAQSNGQMNAADSELLVPPAPAFQRSAHDPRRTLATWDTSSEPDSSAADRFSASALATYLSPAPTRPRRIGGSTDL